jgi:hypothetical protein
VRVCVCLSFVFWFREGEDVTVSKSCVVSVIPPKYKGTLLLDGTAAVERPHSVSAFGLTPVGRGAPGRRLVFISAERFRFHVGMQLAKDNNGLDLGIAAKPSSRT